MNLRENRGILEVENTLGKSAFYKEMDALIKPLGLSLIEAKERVSSRGCNVAIYVNNEAGVTSDELDEVYSLVFLKIKNRYSSLNLEVSTPGTSRNIKDAGEFAFFVGKEVRIYSEEKGEWVYGIISSADEKSVVLSDVTSESKKINEKELSLQFSEIKKARLVDSDIKETK